MKTKKLACRQDEGSIDLMQLFVGLLIISIASIGTFQSLFYGYEQLDGQMRYRKAISVARSYVEYWQGRIHTDIEFTNDQVRNGNIGDPEILLLDYRNPTTAYDDIYCEVSYAPLQLIDEEDTEGTDHILIEVRVSWYEPNDNNKAQVIKFYAAMVPAAL